MTGRIKTIVGYIASVILAAAIITSHTAPAAAIDSAADRKFTVFIVVWRGITDAEKGFIDYFKSRKIKAEFIIRDCNNSSNRLPSILSEIRTVKPDLIYTFGTTVTKYIAGTADDHSHKKNITDIPVIFNIVAKPVESGLVSVPLIKIDLSRAEYDIIMKKVDDLKEREFINRVYTSSKDKKRFILKENIASADRERLIDIFIRTEYITLLTGRNLTGCMHLVPVAAQMKAMKSVLDFTRIGVIYNQAEDNSIKQIGELDRYCNENGLTLVKAPFTPERGGTPDKKQIPSLVQMLADKKVSIIYLPSDSFIIANSAEIMAEINRHRIITFSATEDPIRKSGAMMGLVNRYYNVGLFAGYKAEQILVHGVNPAEIPLETLKRPSFIINIDAAKKTGYYPPVMILRFAEIVKDEKTVKERR